MSLGGMAVELPSALPTGAIHDIALQVGDGPEMVLRMRVSYSRRERRKNRARVYVTGLAFLADVTDRVSESLRLAS